MPADWLHQGGREDRTGERCWVRPPGGASVLMPKEDVESRRFVSKGEMNGAAVTSLYCVSGITYSSIPSTPEKGQNFCF